MFTGSRPVGTRLLALLVFVALVVAACGDDSSGDGEAASDAADESTSNDSSTENDPGEGGDADRRLVYEETFDTDERGWIDSIGEATSDVAVVEVADGMLQLSTNGQGPFVGEASPTVLAVDDGIEDQRVEATFTIGSPAAAVLECRKAVDPDDGSRVQFYVSSSGKAGIDRIPDEAFTDEGLDTDLYVTIDETDFEALDVEDGATYELALECVNNDDGTMTATGYLDGEQIVQGDDADPVLTGFAGVAFDWSSAAAGDVEEETIEYEVTVDRVALYDITGVHPANDDLLVVEDTFADDGAGWIDSTGIDDTSTVQIADGALRYDMAAGGDSGVSTAGLIRAPDVIGSQRIETEATVSAGGAALLTCRASVTEGDTSRIDMVVGADGAGTVYRVPADTSDGEEANTLDVSEYVVIDSVEADTIDIAEDASVELALECRDEADGVVVTGSVNGDEVLSGIDELPLDDGYAGVGADAAATIPAVGTDGYTTAGADAPAYEVSFGTFRQIDLSSEAG